MGVALLTHSLDRLEAPSAELEPFPEREIEAEIDFGEELSGASLLWLETRRAKFALDNEDHSKFYAQLILGSLGQYQITVIYSRYPAAAGRR